MQVAYMVQLCHRFSFALQAYSKYSPYVLPFFSIDGQLHQADTGKLGETDSPFFRTAEEELDDVECLGQVPEASWTVPQIPSPPTASGLYWPKNYQNSLDGAVFVPDICHSPVQNPQHCQHNGTISKRWRRL